MVARGVISKSQAVAQIDGKHARATDAAVVLVDNHLQRYSGSPIAIDARFGAVHVDEAVVEEIIRIYTAAPNADGYAPGWTITRETDNGVPVLKFS